MFLAERLEVHLLKFQPICTTFCLFEFSGERWVHLRKAHGKVIKEKCNYCGIEEFPKKAMYHTCNNMQKFFKESMEDCNKYERSFEELYVDESEKSKN